VQITAKDRVTGAGIAHPPDRPAVDHYATLVEAARGGDARAMEELLVRAQEVAYRFSVTVCGHADDAEDVMQEALIQTFRRARTLRDARAFRPWLYRTVRNACLMARRRRVDEPAVFEPLDEASPRGPGGSPGAKGGDPEAVVVNTRLRQRLRQAMKALPGKYRAVVFLREMEGLSTREVADVLQLSEANVKQRLHRARGMLQASLGDV